MAEHSLAEPFEASGEWFLPDNETRRIHGTLAYTSDATELRLNDPLEPIQIGQVVRLGVDDIRKYPVIYGFTDAAEAVTVLDAWQAGSQLKISSGGSRMPVRLFGNIVVIGAHVKSEVQYSQMRSRVPGLEAWLSGKSLHLSVKEDWSFSLSGAKHHDEVIPVHELGGDLVLRSCSQLSPGAHAASIKTHGYVYIRPREPRLLNFYLEQVPRIMSLLTLVAGSQMSVDQIVLPTATAGQRVSVLVHYLSQKNCPFTQEHEFFLPRSALKECFAQILDNWFSRYPGVQSACGLALSVLNSDDLWPHVEFLALMQALEGFHRALYAGAYMDAGAYEEVRDTLLKAIPASVATSPSTCYWTVCQHRSEKRSLEAKATRQELG